MQGQREWALNGDAKGCQVAVRPGLDGESEGNQERRVVWDAGKSTSGEENRKEKKKKRLLPTSPRAHCV